MNLCVAHNLDIFGEQGDGTFLSVECEGILLSVDKSKSQTKELTTEYAGQIFKLFGYVEKGKAKDFFQDAHSDRPFIIARILLHGPTGFWPVDISGPQIQSFEILEIIHHH